MRWEEVQQSKEAENVANQLDSAQSSMIDNMRDLREPGNLGSDEDVIACGHYIRVLDDVLANWEHIAPYIM